MNEQDGHRGRGKWAQPEVPHKGWVCVGDYDTGPDDLETCEMCESTPVRFVHVMANDRWPEQLSCGCICASHMSEDYVGAEAREKTMRSRASRREHFPKRKGWKVSAKGTPYIKINGFHLMVVRKGGGQFQVAATAPGATSPTWGTKRYATVEEAQLGCFDAFKLLGGA